MCRTRPNIADAGAAQQAHCPQPCITRRSRRERRTEVFYQFLLLWDRCRRTWMSLKPAPPSSSRIRTHSDVDWESRRQSVGCMHIMSFVSAEKYALPNVAGLQPRGLSDVVHVRPPRVAGRTRHSRRQECRRYLLKRRDRQRGDYMKVHMPLHACATRLLCTSAATIPVSLHEDAKFTSP